MTLPTLRLTFPPSVAAIFWVQFLVDAGATRVLPTPDSRVLLVEGLDLAQVLATLDGIMAVIEILP